MVTLKNVVDVLASLSALIAILWMARNTHLLLQKLLKVLKAENARKRENGDIDIHRLTRFFSDDNRERHQHRFALLRTDGCPKGTSSLRIILGKAVAV